MTTISDYEGVLYVEVHKVYEEMYCCLSGRRFQAFRKVKTDLPASGINKAETAVIQFEINVQACDCKVVKYSIADLAKVMKVSKFDETPHFFSITVNNSRTYIVAAKTEQERSAWLRLIRDLTQKSKGQQSSDVFMRTGLLPDSNFPKQGVNRFGSPKKELLPSQRMGLKFQKDEKQRGHRASILEAGDYKKVDRSSGNAMESSDENEGVDGAKDIEEAKDRTNNGNHKMNDTDVDDMPPYPSNRTRQVSLSDDFDEDEGDDDDREGNTIICCKRRERICGIKTDTIIRLVKVALAFPFYDNPDIQRIAIGLYILLYLLPVGLVVFTKVKVSSSTSKIEEGSPMFVTIVTILFMSLYCDYSDDPPVLVQDPSLVCYSDEHIVMARAALVAMAVSRGGSVHPRVLEPLISLTLSLEKEDWEIAKKYISQLVWLISYPNMRVQFQSAWGLANLALLDEDARIKIHEAGGTKTLFEWYLEMDFVVQLETLAAIVNLTLSMTVAEDMVDRHKCIPFFLSLVTSNKIKHAQFSAIAIANLARKENFREMLRVQGGIPALVGCIMSHDYQKRRHGCRALANMALSPSKEIEQVFESKGLIDRIIKMALRQEIETQREVIALIRNLSCHARLRPMLLDRGVMKAVEVSKLSIFEEVRQWCEEITLLLQRELTGSVDLRALMRREGTTIGEADIDLLRKMEPLQGRVEWSTWGSKLESIFAPIFATLPSVMASQLTTTCDTPLSIFLPNGLSKAELNRWRDAVSYSVVERPAHGKLSDYNTVADYVTYTPVAGYVGTDFFTYRMQLGSVSTHPVTVAINVVDAATQIAGGVTEEASTKGVSPKRNNRRGNDQSLEVDLEAARQAAKTTVRLGDPSPRKRGIKKEPVHNKDGPMTLDSIYNKSEDKQGLVSNPSRRQMEVSEEPVQAHKTPFMQSLMKKTSMQISDEQG
eukprot:scaffold1869_cov163-Ochromonas_danica.AAC.2